MDIKRKEASKLYYQTMSDIKKTKRKLTEVIKYKFIIQTLNLLIIYQMINLLSMNV